MPISENPAMNIEIVVSRNTCDKPPISSMNLDSAACSTQPAARNIEALKTAWLMTWKRPAVYPRRKSVPRPATPRPSII